MPRQRGAWLPAMRGALYAWAFALALVVSAGAVAEGDPPASPSEDSAPPEGAGEPDAPGADTEAGDSEPNEDGDGDAAEDAAPAPRGLRRIDAVPGAPVVIVPIRETVELGMSAYVLRALEDHPDAAVVILDINTLGGRVDAAIQMRDALLNHGRPTVAYVHPRAISAGALIALANEQVAVAGGATMGAATPFSGGQPGSGAVEVDAKMISYMRAELRATAEARDRPGELAEAMVDPGVEIDGVVEEGAVLTLDGDQMLRHGIADAEAVDLDALIAQLGLDDHPRITEQENWGEDIARVLTSPEVSGLLLSLGMLAIFLSVYTGNIGPITLAGGLALALFFGGHAMVHLVGLEEVMLFALGIVLIGVELFVTPGFGVIGMAGIATIFLSLTLSLVAAPIDVSFDTGMLGNAFARVVWSFLGTLVGIGLFVKLLPHSPLGRALVLEAAIDGGPEQIIAGGIPERDDLIGEEGEAITDLRPGGKIRIDGARHDAISERDFVPKGARVRVLRAEGTDLVVRLVPEEPQAPADSPDRPEQPERTDDGGGEEA